MQKTLQIHVFVPECWKTQVLGPDHGGAVVANREPGSHTFKNIHTFICIKIYIYINIYLNITIQKAYINMMYIYIYTYMM